MLNFGKEARNLFVRLIVLDNFSRHDVKRKMNVSLIEELAELIG
jgi:hypothetical protein